MFKLLVIDDDEKLCENIQRFYLDIFDVSYLTNVTLEDGPKIKQYIESNNISLVIFDLEIGDVNGFDLFSAIGKLTDIAVIFLSGTSTVDVRIKSLQAGADDFLQKPIDLLELQIKLEKILESKSELMVEHYGDYIIDNKNQVVTKCGEEISLPPLSEKLLKYLLRNQNRDLTRKELLENVWNYYDENGNRIIDTNINIVRTTTRDPNILTVRGVGYRYEEIR